jgi:hypothetical protein
MQYEELNAYNGPYTYACTNEEPEMLRKLIAGRFVRKAAGIASGGEVSFFLLLPRVREELVAVDHSLSSLAIAYTKALLLESLGPTETKKLMMLNNIKKLQEAADKASQQLPGNLKNKWTPEARYNLSCDSSRLATEWGLASDTALKLATKKLDRLTFIHSDLTDIKDKGPFELLYISNAQEHARRQNPGMYNNADLSSTHLDSLLTDDGLILVVSAGSPYPTTRLAWKILNKKPGLRTSWTYYLCQKGN